MSRKPLTKLEAVEYHRNGIAGEGFKVALFTMTDGNTGKERNMLAILFDTDEEGLEFNGRCAVLDRDMTAAGNVKFMENSWRGDQFEEVLRPLIKRALDEKWDALEARLKAQAEAREAI